MPEDHANTTVLVTGASGFIGLHCVLQLLQAGYRVRGTVRSQGRADEVRETMEANVDVADRLEIVEADLTRDEGWADAVHGCSYVLHVASPFPSRTPVHEDELIKPAKDGTLRVLEAAADAGVKRVVITSSLAAVSGGIPSMTHASSPRTTGRSSSASSWPRSCLGPPRSVFHGSTCATSRAHTSPR